MFIRQALSDALPSSKESTVDENKEKALKAALAQIEKQFGKNTIMHLGDETAKLDADVVSTGSLGLDIALGIGGLPKGRIIEIFGPESSGKTTLTLQTIAECQKQGGTCAFIDAEHALDPIYAKKLGVDIDALLVSQPDNGEQALEIADMLGRHRHDRRGLSRRPHPKSRNRRRNGRQPHGSASASDEPSFAQDHR